MEKRYSKLDVCKRAVMKLKGLWPESSSEASRSFVELSHAYGFHESVKNAIFFTGPKSVFYLAGQMGVFRDLEDDSQRFVTFPEQRDFTAVAQGAKSLMALASERNRPEVVVHNLRTLVKRKLPRPEHLNSSLYVCVGISANNEFVAAMGGTPDWLIIIWSWGVHRIEVVQRPIRPELGSRVNDLVFHPSDPLQMVLVGLHFLRHYRYQERKVLRERVFYDLERSGQEFRSAAWIAPQTFAVGSSGGSVYLFRENKLENEIRVGELVSSFDVSSKSAPQPVSCLISCKEGILCCYGGNRALLLKPDIRGQDFNIDASIYIPVDKFSDSEEKSKEKIIHMIFNSSEDTLVATTDLGQILIYSFLPQDLLKHEGPDEKIHFVSILERQSSGAVFCLDRAIRKPVLLTCSSHCLILWDYLVGQQRMWRHFKETICSVTIHPLGLTLGVGFPNIIKIFSIRPDRIVQIMTLDSKSNDRLSYSHAGHLLAVVNEEVIDVFFALTFNHVVSFQRNKGKVLCLTWNNNDTLLYYCNENGEVHELNVVDRKSWIHSTPEVVCHSLMPYSGGVYAAGSDSKIRYVLGGKVSKKIDVGEEVTAMAFTPSEEVIVVGTSRGTVLGFRLPLKTGSVAMFNYHCHHGRVTNLNVDDGCDFLFSTGADGMFCKWTVWDPDRKEGEHRMPFADDILVEREALNQNEQLIHELQLKLGNLEKKYDRERKEQSERHSQQKRDIIEKYQGIIQRLQETVTDLHQEEHLVLCEKEKENLEKVEAIIKERSENLENAQLKLQKEEEHYENLQREYESVKESYEERIKKLREHNEAEYEALRTGYERKVQELESALQEETQIRERLAARSAPMLRRVEEEASLRELESKAQFMIDFKMYRSQIEELETELEEVEEKLSYEKECARTLEAVDESETMGLKKMEQIVTEIRSHIHHVKHITRKKETILENQARMIHKLQEENEDMQRLNSDVKCELAEWQKNIENKASHMTDLEKDVQDLKLMNHRYVDELKLVKNENFRLNDQLRAVKCSIQDDTAKLQKTQIVLERYRSEFVEATEGIEDPKALRAALLRVFEKHVRSCRMIKEEEVSLGDLNPYTKFCRQRDHYGDLMDVVQKRIHEIETTFNKKYVKVAKENSELTAMANGLREVLEQKRERIRCMERAIGMKRDRFFDDPGETRRRLQRAAAHIAGRREQETDQLEKRRSLIREQEKELLRLHALLVVGEDGRIVKEAKVG